MQVNINELTQTVVDTKELEELQHKSKSYDEVGKAYEYYMPNGETQYALGFVRELNRILISNFRPPVDFSKFRDYDLSNFNEHKTKAEAFDDIFRLYIGYEDGWINFPEGQESFVQYIINVCKEYERKEDKDETSV